MGGAGALWPCPCHPKPRIRLLHENPGAFFLSLERFGYDVADGRAAITAFQRRFRPRIVDGELDGEVGRSSSNCCSPATPPRMTIAAATISVVSCNKAC
jgi:hypothetical protein